MKNLLVLNTLHFFNDGFKSSLILLLPFITKDLHISLTQAGLLGSLLNLLAIIFALPAGYIASKTGGLKVLILAIILYSFGFLGTSFSSSYYWLFPTFILADIGFGLFHPISLALIARLAEKTSRGKKLGNFMAVGDLGNIGIPTALTFIVVLIGWRSTTAIYAVIALIIAFSFLLFYFKNRDIFSNQGKDTTHITFLKIIKHKRFLLALTANFFDNFASSTLFLLLPFLLLKRNVDPALLGAFAAVFFLGNFFGKTVLGRIADIFNHAKIFILSELLMAIFIVALATTTNFFIIIICSILLGIFTKGTLPIGTAMISEASEHHGNFEKAFGINTMAANIGTTIAPVLFGFISDQLSIVAAFYTMAFIAILAIIPAFFFNVTSTKS
ncbi:MFS transporter [Candidatus Roizmanbacteria bacterium]|nr:MFS transporter [Candidatus Roizmanbacteria bacterium]